MDIKSITGRVLFSGIATTIKELLIAAIKSGADLRRADLYGADLRSANLSGANLSGADLRSANLFGADLRSANLFGANLFGANLRSANLFGANLFGANLHGADLYGADLRRADLYGADLRSANLLGADLYGADLHGADLFGANLYGAKNLSDRVAAETIILPEGHLIGWKKCRDGVIVKLMIPQHAKRSNATGRKCRAEYVKVLRVFGAEVGISTHDGKTEYRKGDIVKCDTWIEDRWIECAGGIHFFLTRIEAENY